jgi:hypothetical protein
MIKSYLIESIVDVESINDDEPENVQSIDENIQSTESSSDDENQNLASEILARFIRARRLSLRY